jgi:hypothetical protein
MKNGRYICRVYLKKKNKYCNKPFETLTAFLQHKRFAKGHTPSWIQQSTRMRQVYQKYGKHLTEKDEIFNITDTRRTTKQKWVPRQKYVETIRIGDAQKLDPLECKPEGGTYGKVFRNMYILYRCPVESCGESKKPKKSYDDVRQHIDNFHSTTLEPAIVRMVITDPKKDPEYQLKQMQRREVWETMQMIRRKRRLAIWDSPVSSPGNMTLDRIKPREFDIPYGVKDVDEQEQIICLHCGQPMSSLVEWEAHTRKFVIPALKAYSRQKTAIKGPNKHHSFRTEKHSSQKKTPEFWTEVDEQTTSGKHHTVDEEATRKKMDALRRYPSISVATMTSNPHHGYLTSLERDRKRYAKLTKKQA